MKYYAVRAGKSPGIYTSWEECKKQVHGFKGAQYKSFPTKAEAEAFMGAENLSAAPDETRLAADEALAYVDGSYNIRTKAVGYGVVLFTAEGTEELSGTENGDFSEQRNVAGEVFGSRKAISEAILRGKKKLTICYDYAGIRHWALGEWKANLPLTQEYQAFCEEASGKISLSFVKIRAHSGNAYNDRADLLAKKGSGIEE